MNTILLLCFEILGIICVSAREKPLICYSCLDYRKFAGCIHPSTCKPARGQMCQIEQIYSEDEPRQGCTTELKYCSTTRMDDYYGAITTRCCDHCEYCNKA